MELKMFLQIVRRRWLIIIIVPVLVSAFVAFQERSHDPIYTTTVRASVIRHPDPSLSSEDAYYNYVASEFAIDDLVEAVRGNVFADAVAVRAQSGPADAAHQDHPASIHAERRHRIMDIHVESRDAATAERVGRAAASELEEHAFEYLGLTAAESSAIVQIIQRPGAASPDSGRHRLLLLIQIVAALGAGVLLAFLIDYLDDSLHDGETAAAAMRLPHLATIPGDGTT
jgi:capsular polysaccharide biosynthesis protein